MASHTYSTRLQREYKALMREPLQGIVARPSTNILEWHYVIYGPAGTPYEGGEYHGILRFTTEYPMKPPSIMMVTPSGRFEPNTRLCLSMSDFHPETWNPMWSVGSILMGLLSFMLEDTVTSGSITTTRDQKVKLAQYSRKFNRSNRVFAKVFPDLMNESAAPAPAPVPPPGAAQTPSAAAASTPAPPAAAAAGPGEGQAAGAAGGAVPEAKVKEYLMALAAVSAVLIALLMYSSQNSPPHVAP